MATLDYLTGPSGPTQRIELTVTPFVLGRGARADFIVPSDLVSKAHAEIVQNREQFLLRDLGSLNGTYVNGEPVQTAVLAEGDIIHIAHSEFRFSAASDPAAPTETSGLLATNPVSGKVPPSVLYGKPLLEQMLDAQAVHVIFQPIVDLHTNAIVAFEALGRGRFPELSTRPAELFRLAQRCLLARELSRVFRQHAVQQAHTLPTDALMFCNLHPEEFAQLASGQFDQLLEDLPADSGLVLEIHEDAVTDLELLREFREHLKARGIGLAYDDFGAGQSRLTELAEVPPDYLKLDMRLIRDIHSAVGRRDLVRAICDAADRLGVVVIAEGLERPEELEVCKQLGCALGQGFLLGHPEHTATHHLI